jgi:hypothetical protein
MLAAPRLFERDWPAGSWPWANVQNGKMARAFLYANANLMYVCPLTVLAMASIQI